MQTRQKEDMRTAATDKYYASQSQIQDFLGEGGQSPNPKIPKSFSIDINQ